MMERSGEGKVKKGKGGEVKRVRREEMRGEKYWIKRWWKMSEDKKRKEEIKEKSWENKAIQVKQIPKEK